VELDPTAPADTAMMRIVHDALRRDLRRATHVLTEEPRPDERQVRAVADHLRWMMAFLERHHRLEDDGLYPAVRGRDPGSTAILDDMALEHRAVASAVDEVRRAASVDADRRSIGRMASSVEALSDVLLPHLAREERDAMPVVSRVLTNAEWDAIEQENLAATPVTELAREGHWLIDEADPADRTRVLGLVPPLQRAFLLYGFGLSYRRHKLACWSPSRRIPREATVAIDVDADIDAIWSIVSDPTRVGEWSHECLGADWIGGHRRSVPGARFRGRNRQGGVRWGRECEIVRCETYEIVWRTVPSWLYPDSSEWSIRLNEVQGGTRIEQSYEVLKSTYLEPLYAVVVPAHRDRGEALRRDLERIGELAGAEPRIDVDHGAVARGDG